MPQNLALSPNPVEDRTLLRFITCGSVDDGKSTLIGRMLYDARAVFEDQFQALKGDSRKYGTTGADNPDFALLVDGLQAEREQGITIDVAYRYFATDKRKFIVADTPGHEQYTRNMATGASTADLAIVIVDAAKGIRPQTRRHSLIVSMLGVRHVVLAVNKIDLMGYSRDVFAALEKEYAALAGMLGFASVQAIPLSALHGDNVTKVSGKMPWYGGPSLFDYLEAINIARADPALRPFVMPVQWVSRPNPGFRGFAGQVAGGGIAPGGDMARAEAGKAVVLTLADEVDVSRGDVIASVNNACEVTDILKAKILWTAEKEMVAGRQYIFRSATAQALCTAGAPEAKVDIDTCGLLPAKAIGLNEIGICQLFLDRMIACETYASSRDLGSFVLIDRVTHETVAMGMIDHPMRRSRNVQEQKLTIDRAARAGLKEQKPCVLWLTGLSGAGKSAIADSLEQRLHAAGRHTIILDGDNIRRGLSRDLGFTEQDRAENIRRAAEVAKLMMDAGLITLVSFISPFRAEREMAREIIGKDNFIEVFVDVPLHVAEARDVKGLYKKARAGEIPNFTGIGSPYEAPEHPDLHLKAAEGDPALQAEIVLRYLKDRGFV
ncbi:MAG: adenylyl-sulfate kinase [Micavibrio aeruginosavorus]|nr:adenylyl-sulfate kinase [Micavibrio aeruginosavorus]